MKAMKSPKTAKTVKEKKIRVAKPRVKSNLAVFLEVKRAELKELKAKAAAVRKEMVEARVTARKERTEKAKARQKAIADKITARAEKKAAREKAKADKRAAKVAKLTAALNALQKPIPYAAKVENAGKRVLVKAEAA
jgi:hypothetical protein